MFKIQSFAKCLKRIFTKSSKNFIDKLWMKAKQEEWEWIKVPPRNEAKTN